MKLTFKTPEDRAIAVDAEARAIERRGWTSEPSTVTFIDDTLAEDVKAELDVRGIVYEEGE